MPGHRTGGKDFFMNEKKRNGLLAVIVALLVVMLCAVFYAIGAATAKEETQAATEETQDMDVNGDGEVTVTDYTLNRLNGYKIVAEVLDITVDEAIELLEEGK